MLSVAIGDTGSFCDECAVRTTRGFELTGMPGIFLCMRCASTKFGERETDRAIENVKAMIAGGGMGKVMPVTLRDPLPQRPMGFIRRDDQVPPGPTCASEKV